MRIKLSGSQSSERRFPLERLLPRKPSGWLAFGSALGFLLAAVIGLAFLPQMRTRAVQAVRSWGSQLTQGAVNAAQDEWIDYQLPTMHLDIDFEAFQAMSTQRQEALEKGILVLDDEDWHRADIRYGADSVPVRVRLKGDWTDHLGEKKWSFRVKTRNDAAIMGMRSFSLQSPATRGYLNEWLFLAELRRADVLAPRYTFVNLHVNGENWGIYALEESFSKELLESMGRRAGVIVRYDESLMWERMAWAGAANGTGSVPETPWDPAATYGEFSYAIADDFDTNAIAADPLLREQSAAALSLLRGFQAEELSVDQAFDAEVTGRYLAQSMLWGASHGVLWHNVRYYYNPLTGLLEPIAYDTMPFDPEGFPTELAQYENLEVMRAYAQEASRISDPAYVAELQQVYGEELARYQRILGYEFPAEKLSAPWNALAENAELMAAVFRDGARTVFAYQVASTFTDETSESGDAVTLFVGNILRYPVVLSSLRCGDREVPIAAEWVAEEELKILHREALPAVVLRRGQMRAPQYLALAIPRTTFETLGVGDGPDPAKPLQIVTQLFGIDREVAVDVRSNYAPVLETGLLPEAPILEQVLRQHPFLESGPAGYLTVKPGSWRVNGDLVLPKGYGLWAEGRVTLRFDEGALLLVQGPLHLVGTEPDGIQLAPRADSWAGLMVLRAESQGTSELRNVLIRGTVGIDRQGWMTTGGVTFYESPVTLDGVRFLDSQAEDALNIVRTRFTMSGCEFADHVSDAFDGDFVEGRITESLFHDLLGDGIDISGSHLTVDQTELMHIADKGLSIGEGSTAQISQVSLVDVGIGIASKDLSKVTAQNVSVSRAAIAGLAAYLKKEEYGSASIDATDVVFADQSQQTLAQIGSSIRINGSNALPVELDVDELYARLEARPYARPIDYRMGASIHLTGYYLQPTEARPGDRLHLTLFWISDAPLKQNYSIFVHVLDAQGQRVAQRDSMPRENAFPTSRWSVGETIDDMRSISLPNDLPAGTYQVYLGMYLLETGERLPIIDVEGREIPEAALLLPESIHVAP